MKNPIIAVLAIACIISLFACKKDKGTDPIVSRKIQLMGTWKVFQIAKDENQNNIMDGAEVHDDTLYHLTWTFGASDVKVIVGTGETINTVSGQWQFKNYEQDIEMLGSLFHIDKLTNSDLILKDSSSNSPLQWQILKKQ